MLIEKCSYIIFYNYQRSGVVNPDPVPKSIIESFESTKPELFSS